MKNFTRFFICSLVATFGQVALAAPHKVRIDDPILSKSLVAQGAKVIGDYGAFAVLEADDALLGNGISNRVEVADDWNLIRLNSRVIDTRAPETKALRKSRGVFAGKRLHLVQFAGPVKPRWLEELKQNGVQIVSYIPENSYLIYGDTAALARLQAWAGTAEFTQWEGEYSHDLKVHFKARALAAANAGGKIAAGVFEIQLIADTNSNPATLALIDRLKTAPLQLDSQANPYRNLIVSLPSDQLDTIAAQPDVISVQVYAQPKKRDERQDQIIAGNLAGTVPNGSGYLDWLASKGFTQQQFDDSGFVVDVADSGIDNGGTIPGHFGLYRLGDRTQSSRLAYVHLEGNSRSGGTLAGCDGHGALNAHIIGNYDNFTGEQHRDAQGYSYGIGVCPFVALGSSVIFDNSVPDRDFTNPDLDSLASDAYSHGARVSNNSWGSDAGGDYDFVAQTYDRLVRDAQLNVVGNQEMTFVFAAGNAGPCIAHGSSLGIDSPGSAKNIITVGASENVRSLNVANGGNDPDGLDTCGESDTNADSADDIDCGSSRGPCSDGRMKPDLVAPGTHITGGVPQETPPPDPAGTGSAISCFNALGVCALQGSGTTGNADNFFPIGQQFYTESSGTSHATPVVAGACALIRQYFINNHFDVPSPAMTKAFLMNSARYLTGDGANDTLWSASQGMGEVNLGSAFDGVTRTLRDQVIAEKFTATGQRRAYVGQVADSSKPTRVTLAWTDAPGSTAGAAYKNNLDLTVTVAGNTYLGNVFNGKFSATGGKADSKNNVESVFLPAGLSGEITVTVTAANINSDGVTNESPALDQDFALVIYNAAATNKPTFGPAAASYNGLFYEASGATLGRSGAITVTTTAAGGYSGKLQIGSKSSSFSGTFDPFGAATNVIARAGTVPLALALNINLDDNSIITGTVSDPGNWTAALRGERAVVAAKSAPAAFAGNYTLIIQGTNGEAQLPFGDGYGTVAVSTAGKIKLAGSLADGTKLAQSATMAVDGEWPVYVSLYAGQGQLLGWLRFTNSGPEALSGDFDWIKGANGAAKLFPGGFNFDTHVSGSAYRASVSPFFNFNNGGIVLGGGNLLDTNMFGVTINGTKVVGTNKLVFKMSVAKGTFKGSVPNPPNKAPISFSGVFLQDRNLGLGYFLGTNQSGRILFGPAD